MRVYYDTQHHAWRIDSPTIDWLAGRLRARFWKGVFVVAYVIFVAWLAVELAEWVGGWE